MFKFKEKKIDKVKEMLEERILEIEGFLETVDPSTEEYAKASNTLEKLYKLRIEENKNDKDGKDRWINRFITLFIELVGIVLPLGFYAVWMKRGLKFEETGSFTSQTFRGLISNFKPKRK